MKKAFEFRHVIVWTVIAIISISCLGKAENARGYVYEQNPDDSTGRAVQGANVTWDYKSTDIIDFKMMTGGEGSYNLNYEEYYGDYTVFVTIDDYADFRGWKQDPPIYVTLDENEPVFPGRRLPDVLLRKMKCTAAPQFTREIGWNEGKATQQDGAGAYPLFSLEENIGNVVVLISTPQLSPQLVIESALGPALQDLWVEYEKASKPVQFVLLSIRSETVADLQNYILANDQSEITYPIVTDPTIPGQSNDWDTFVAKYSYAGWESAMQATPGITIVDQSGVTRAIKYGIADTADAREWVRTEVDSLLDQSDSCE